MYYISSIYHLYIIYIYIYSSQYIIHIPGRPFVVEKSKLNSCPCNISMTFHKKWWPSKDHKSNK